MEKKSKKKVQPNERNAVISATEIVQGCRMKTKRDAKREKMLLLLNKSLVSPLLMNERKLSPVVCQHKQSETAAISGSNSNTGSESDPKIGIGVGVGIGIGLGIGIGPQVGPKVRAGLAGKITAQICSFTTNSDS